MIKISEKNDKPPEQTRKITVDPLVPDKDLKKKLIAKVDEESEPV